MTTKTRRTGFAARTVVGALAAALVTMAVAAPQRAAAASPSECDAVVGNLVTNCGFETGDFTGYNRGGNLGSTYVSNAYAHSGTYGTQLGPGGSDGTLSQNLVLTPGATYQLSFYLKVGPAISNGGTQNDFGATVTLSDGDHTFFQQSNIPAQSYTQYSYSFTVPSNATPATLTFNFRDDPGYLSLDDIVVVQTAAGGGGGGGTATPELGSGELLATGLLPLGAALLYRRRRARRAAPVVDDRTA